ncbi:hypothetical protein [Citrobacter sp. Cu233]|uniref:hypothetical protein n=1 Tax=Citrobacter sp. Cu233 TaxID=2985160 RepID=UPI002574975D|nr:hypothetical protein [Citrobacter sp. Cu233]MDM2933284.1 hypothetical protein [Citrobacter sp. Cu233]
MTTLRCTNVPVKAGLFRYACAAMLARIADGGGVLAVILLCQSSEQYFSVRDLRAAGIKTECPVSSSRNVPVEPHPDVV